MGFWESLLTPQISCMQRQLEFPLFTLLNYSMAGFCFSRNIAIILQSSVFLFTSMMIHWWVGKKGCLLPSSKDGKVATIFTEERMQCKVSLLNQVLTGRLLAKLSFYYQWKLLALHRKITCCVCCIKQCTIKICLGY